MSMRRSDFDGNLGERICIIDAKSGAAIISDVIADLPNTEVSA